MAYDTKLTDRITKLLAGTRNIEKKNMFGGICFLHRGNMICGVSGKLLMVRVGPKQYEAALSRKHAVEMDITGRPMKGFIFVKPEGFRNDGELSGWLQLGLNFTKSLPAKKKTKKSASRSRMSTPR